MTNETVSDVCAEIKREADYDAIANYNNFARRIASLMTNWYGRILSAHERELAAKDAEIARLKDALKPVMNACAEDAKCDAVREAQRIYMEGEAK